MEENDKRKTVENEAKDSLSSSSITPTYHSKDKGKFVLDCPTKSQPLSTLEVLQRSAKIKEILKIMS